MPEPRLAPVPRCPGCSAVTERCERCPVSADRRTVSTSPRDGEVKVTPEELRCLREVDYYYRKKGVYPILKDVAFATASNRRRVDTVLHRLSVRGIVGYEGAYTRIRLFVDLQEVTKAGVQVRS